MISYFLFADYQIIIICDNNLFQNVNEILIFTIFAIYFIIKYYE